jgi:hypothetical protein
MQYSRIHSIYNFFPQVKLKDFLVQVAQDIITILIQPSSTTLLSLEDSNLVKNAILKLENQLKRIDKLPEPGDYILIGDIPNRKRIDIAYKNIIPNIIQHK